MPETADLPPGQARAVRAASVEASTDAFHLGLLIAALLMIAGGAAAGIGIENPRPARAEAAEAEPA